MQDVIDIEVTPLVGRLRRRDQGRRPHPAAVRGHRAGHQGRLGQAPRAGVPRPERSPRTTSFASPSYFGDLGSRKKAPEALRPAPKACSRTTRRCCWSATSRSTACRSARSAKASSGSTSIPAIRRGPTSTRSSTRSSCRRPAATRCSPTCTRPMRRCRRRSRRSSRARRRCTSTNTTAPSRRTPRATSAASRTTPIRSSSRIPTPAARRCSSTG